MNTSSQSSGTTRPGSSVLLSLLGVLAFVGALMPTASAQWDTALVIEAEDFSSKPIGGPIPDGWNIWSSGAITEWVVFPEALDSVRIRVIAGGKPAYDVWPKMGLSFNQHIEAFYTVDQPGWTSYSAELPAPSDEVQIGIYFLNDAYNPEQGEDRNLHADRYEIAVPTGTPPADWPVITSPPPYMDEPTVPATDVEVLALAEGNIEAHRKGDFYARLVDHSGMPLQDQTVLVDMVRHHFRWGTCVSFDETPAYPDFEETYRRTVGELFNYATTESLLKWRIFEPVRDEPFFLVMDGYLDLCDQMGVELKGHTLVWGATSGIPEWFEPDDVANAMLRLENRVRRDTAYYAGRIPVYDVVNEPMHTLQWDEWAGPQHLESALAWAREEDPQAALLVNEYDLVTPSMCDNFFIRMRGVISRGAPLDGVGIQSHQGRWDLPRHQWRCYERLAQLGRSLHITEFTLDTTGDVMGGPYEGMPWTDELQAEYYEQVMRVAFGHPAIEAFTFWGFVDRRMWQPGGGLFDEDFQIKPCGLTYKDLVHKEWSTLEEVATNSAGEASFRGFYGRYRVLGDSGQGFVDLIPSATGTPADPVEIMLDSPIAFGDFDGDGDVDIADYDQFATCFTGPGGGPVPLECRFGDFDTDSDLDCDDWQGFTQAWTEATDPPQLPQCAEAPVPAVSHWGVIAMGTLLLATGAWVCIRRRVPARPCT